MRAPVSIDFRCQGHLLGNVAQNLHRSDPGLPSLIGSHEGFTIVLKLWVCADHFTDSEGGSIAFAKVPVRTVGDPRHRGQNKPVLEGIGADLHSMLFWVWELFYG